MKRIVVFLLTILVVFGISSCSYNDKIMATSNTLKESPSTVLSIEVSEKSFKDESVIIKVGVGKRIYSQYNTYINTILSIEAPSVIVNGSPDQYCKEFDITGAQYLCTEDHEPQHFIEIPLDFSNCEQHSGTVVIKLISYTVCTY